MTDYTIVDKEGKQMSVSVSEKQEQDEQAGRRAERYMALLKEKTAKEEKHD